ncbi:MAG: molybdopterin-synthase adenylyltransferase MoeB [Verrucomicrobiales bacterium]|nr:molybdopterin-synthase adenylyltransferase MoeB [Verrucomicrobiota bacterium JB025]
MAAPLTPQELHRYSRHILIPDIGEHGQQRLKDSSVLLVGTGALGSPAAIYLAAAGVGRLGLVDDDTVESSNLQRQVLHGESWIGKPKLDSAAARLHEVNPHVNVELHPTRFTPDNAEQIAASYQIIVDGSDNFPTRFLTNDTAYFQRKPLVYGAIHQFEGQTSVFAPHLGGPCVRCMLPAMPAPGAVPSCAEAGVLGVLPGVIGSIQAMETLKILLGIGTPPLGKLTVYQALDSSFRSLRLERDPRCRLCGENPQIHSVSNSETTAGTTCQPAGMGSIDVTRLRSLLDNNFTGILLDVREPFEHAMTHIDGALLMPLGSVPERFHELPKDKEILVLCKAGVRSAMAAEFLLDHGFRNIKNIEGGMNAWHQMESGI